MTSIVRFEALGLQFDLTSSHPDAMAVFEDLLVDMRPGATSGRAADHRIRIEPVGDGVAADDAEPRWVVTIDDRTVYPRLAQGSVVSHVLMEVNQHVADAVQANGSIPLHACTVTGRSGAIVLAGSSRSGKTTLAAALCVAGPDDAEFLADEISALHPTHLTISPYGKPVAVRTPGLDLLAGRVTRLRRPANRFATDERFVPPSELGAPSSGPALAIAVVFPRFDPTATTTRLARVPAVEALTRLMHCTLGSQQPDTATFRALERLVRDIDVYDLVHPDALDAVDRLHTVLADGTPA